MIAVRSFYCALCLAVTLASPSVTASLQDLRALPAQVHDYLMATLHDPDLQGITIQVTPFDPRLRLSACDNPLTFQQQNPSSNASNVTVKVSCTGNQSWSLFASARVQRYVQVLAAAKPLERGQTLQRTDLQLVKRDLSLTGTGFKSDFSSVVGKQLRRPMRQGDPIRASLLEAPLLVNKGDQLVIEANNGSIRVLTAGIALSHGKLGQQIRVKNTHSERTFKARVIAAGKVQVTL